MENLSKLFDNQKSYVLNFFCNISLKETMRQVELFCKCQGMVFFCGIGKSEFVAKKISATMTSIGVRSSFLSPTNALHGDIGLVSNKDIVVFISNSGESEELIDLVPYIKERKSTTVAWTSSSNSRLHKVCNMGIEIPVKRELCPYNLSPTTSPTIQMLLGDIITAAIIHEKKLSIKDYSKNHPCGRIGKRSSVKVKDIMIPLKNTSHCFPNDKIGTTLSLHLERRLGATMVVDKKCKLCGIFTDGDISRAIENYKEKIFTMTTEKIMTTTPKTISSQELAWKALQIMEEKIHGEFTIMPVVNDDGTVKGLIKLHDIIHSGI